MQVVAEMEFDIPHMYRFHNEKNKDVQVDLIRINVTERQDELPNDNEEGKVG